MNVANGMYAEHGELVAECGPDLHQSRFRQVGTARKTGLGDAAQRGVVQLRWRESSYACSGDVGRMCTDEFGATQ